MSEKITFQELIDSIADKTDNSKKFTHDFLKDFADVINSGLEEDGKVNIAGLGKFGLRRLDEREGYNPQTGESMTIPAHNKIIFKPYKELRELVNAPYIDMEPEIIDEEGDTGPAESKDEQEQQNFIPTAQPPALEDDGEKHSDEEKEDSFTKRSPETTSSKFTFDDKEDESNNDSEDSYNDDIVEYRHGKDTFDEDLEAFISGENPDNEEDDYTPPADDEEFSEEEPAPMENDPAVFSSLENDRTENTETENFTDSEPTPQPDISRKTGRETKTNNKSIIMAAAVIILLLVAGSGYMLIQSQQGNNDVSEQASSASTAIIDQNQENDADQRAQKQDAEQQPVQSPQANRQNQQSAENKSVDLEIAQGQTLWSMAENRYNNPYLWPWIYDANKSSIDDPDLIIAGQTLTVPIPSGAQNSLTSGDSLEVAVGYVETYKWYKDKGMDNAKLYLWVAANYDENILNRTDFEIDKDDLAFANRSQVQ